MRKLILAVVAMALIGVNSMKAEFGTKTDAKEIRKERVEIQKMKAKDLNKQLSKMVDKEYARLISAGWRCKEGDAVLKNQIENAYTVQYEYDDNLFPRSFTAEGTSMGKDKEMAKERAIEQAQKNLIDAVQRELKTMLEFAESEKKLKPKDTKVIRASLVDIMKDLSPTLKQADVIYELTGAQGKNNEIFVKVACSSGSVIDQAKILVQENLREKGESYLGDRVNIIFNWKEATKAEKVK